MRIFLTSSVHAVASDIASKVDLDSGSKLVFIDTAAEVEEGDKQWLRDDRQALVDAGFNVTDYTITDKDSSQLEKDLSNYDYIYNSGGNTYYLLQQSRKSGFVNVIRNLICTENKTYIGTSAGSIITGPVLPEYLVELDDRDAYEAEDYSAYGFVNFILLPHWGSDGFKHRYLDNRMEIAYRHDQYPLILLTDMQYVYVHDDNHVIVDLSHV